MCPPPHKFVRAPFRHSSWQEMINYGVHVPANGINTIQSLVTGHTDTYMQHIGSHTSKPALLP
jgi:hypothetical protein